MKRLTIFSFYDPNNLIDDYVLHYLKALKKVSDIIFVADNNLPDEKLDKIQNLTIKIICEKHGEYDFGSYKRGFIWSKEKILDKYDCLILANDSVFGPFYPFEIIFEKMEQTEADFWGFTKNTIDVKPHIQSYFVSMNRNVFLSPQFEAFILSIKKQKIRRNIILKYEHGLTEILNLAGFKDTSFFKETENSFAHDPVKDWDRMIAEGYPFIKRSLFTRNIYNLSNLKNYKEVIKSNFKQYDISMIEKNLKRITIKKHSFLSYSLKKILELISHDPF